MLLGNVHLFAAAVLEFFRINFAYVLSGRVYALGIPPQEPHHSIVTPGKVHAPRVKENQMPSKQCVRRSWVWM